jgi:HD-GYP domain-containing protein (c-di-GMP phosphodiesterase class II)
MKTHTTIGGQLLAGSPNPLLQMAETIALSHHEHWDGSGYPAGLTGEDIPLPGRICAIADVYDALLSNRPYKRAWPLDDVLTEIKRGSGTQFDPALVVAFLRIAPRTEEELASEFTAGAAAFSPFPAGQSCGGVSLPRQAAPLRTGERDRASDRPPAVTAVE